MTLNEAVFKGRISDSSGETEKIPFASEKKHAEKYTMFNIQ